MLSPDPQQWRNPLRDDFDKRLPRIAGPSGLVIFGVTGDLARKKLLPAVYDLASRGLLPAGFSLVGYGRRDWSDEEFAEQVKASVQERARNPWRDEVWERLAEGIFFVKGDFVTDSAFDALAAKTQEIDQLRGTAGLSLLLLLLLLSRFGWSTPLGAMT